MCPSPRSAELHHTPIPTRTQHPPDYVFYIGKISLCLISLLFLCLTNIARLRHFTIITTICWLEPHFGSSRSRLDFFILMTYDSCMWHKHLQVLRHALASVRVMVLYLLQRPGLLCDGLEGYGASNRLPRRRPTRPRRPPAIIIIGIFFMWRRGSRHEAPIKRQYTFITHPLFGTDMRTYRRDGRRKRT